MEVQVSDIEAYLSDVKEAIKNHRYRIDRNTKWQDNMNLFLDYVIDEQKAKEILLSLTPMDFSDTVQNKIVISFHEQKHPLKYYFKQSK